MSYHISAPMYAFYPDRELDLDRALQELKRTRSERVFLIAPDIFSQENLLARMPRLSACLEFFAQLTHAGRSGSRNFCASALELLDVARASLCELRYDCNTWLMMNGLAPWPMDSEQAQRLYGLRLDAPDYGNDINRGVGLHILAQYPACRDGMEYRAKTTADERSNT